MHNGLSHPVDTPHSWFSQCYGRGNAWTYNCRQLVCRGAATATRCREDHRRGRSCHRRPRRRTALLRGAPISQLHARLIYRSRLPSLRSLPGSLAASQAAPHSAPDSACLAVGVPIGASLRALPPIVPACSQKHRLVRTGALLRLVLGPSTAAGTSSTPRPSPQESGAVPGSRRAPAPQPTVRPVPGVFSRPGVGIFDLSPTSQGPEYHLSAFR
jgi:hypothetical protein